MKQQIKAKGARHLLVERCLAPSAFFFFLLFSPSQVGVAAPLPDKKLHVGEKLVYTVRWIGIEVGIGEARVKEIAEINGRKAYHIVVNVRSAPFLDFLYKVRDVHHSYIDVERLHSLRYEKILSEGRYRADEVMEYDQKNHRATYLSRKNGSKKSMMIPPDVHDPLSAGYGFRLQNIESGSSVHIPVNADEKNWDLEVKALRKEKRKNFGAGLPPPYDREIEVLEIDPEIQFQGIFVKRGKVRGWIGLDERRIPLEMKVKIPVLGSIAARLIQYHPGE